MVLFDAKLLDNIFEVSLKNIQNGNGYFYNSPTNISVADRLLLISFLNQCHSSLSDITAMSEYPHQHRALGQGRSVLPTGGLPTPTAFNLDRWENLIRSGDNDATGGDIVQGSESGEQL